VGSPGPGDTRLKYQQTRGSFHEQWDLKRRSSSSEPIAELNSSETQEERACLTVMVEQEKTGYTLMFKPEQSLIAKAPLPSRLRSQHLGRLLGAPSPRGRHQTKAARN